MQEQEEAKRLAPADDDTKCIVIKVSKRKYALAVKNDDFSEAHYEMITKPMHAQAAWRAREYYHTVSCSELEDFLRSVRSGYIDL